MNPFDFQLLSWDDDLSKLSIYQLAMWIRDQSRKAYDGLQINREKVICLYDEWGFLYQAENAELPEDFPAEARTLFFKNQEILNSRNYQRAIMLLYSPLPNYQYLPKNGTHYEPIPVVMWTKYPEQVIKTALKQVEHNLITVEELVRSEFKPREYYQDVEACIDELRHTIEFMRLPKELLKKALKPLDEIDKLRKDGLQFSEANYKKISSELKKLGRVLHNSGQNPSVYKNVDIQLNRLDRLLYSLRYTPNEYREDILKFLRADIVKRAEEIRPKFSSNEKVEIARAVTNADKLTFYFNELDLGLHVETSKLYALESYGISRTHVKSFLDERCDKYTVLRFCFALKIRGEIAECFLQKEGFSLNKSIRSLDRRINNILAVSCDYKAFAALLDR